MLKTLSNLLADPGLLETRAFVAGEWVDAADGATFAVTNPARGDVIAEVADLSRAEVAPFGGVKQSGPGREGSRHGILDCLETKYICTAI